MCLQHIFITSSHPVTVIHTHTHTLENVASSFYLIKLTLYVIPHTLFCKPPVIQHSTDHKLHRYSRSHIITDLGHMPLAKADHVHFINTDINSIPLGSIIVQVPKELFELVTTSNCY